VRVGWRMLGGSTGPPAQHGHIDLRHERTEVL
jgi:hypothetical protein